MFSDGEINAIFTQVEAEYGSANAPLGLAAAVVVGLEARLAGAVGDVSYSQGASSESLSDRARILMDLLTYWKSKRDEQSSRAYGGVRVATWGGPGTPPTRIKDYPDA